MEIVKIKCPSCKADIKVAKEGMARCPYCGTGIYAERKDENSEDVIIKEKNSDIS